MGEACLVLSREGRRKGLGPVAEAVGRFGAPRALSTRARTGAGEAAPIGTRSGADGAKQGRVTQGRSHVVVAGGSTAKKPSIGLGDGECNPVNRSIVAFEVCRGRGSRRARLRRLPERRAGAVGRLATAFHPRDQAAFEGRPP